MFSFGADVGALFDPRNVVGMGAMIKASRPFCLVELDENPGFDSARSEDFLFRLGTIAPEDALRLAKPRGFLDPCNHVQILCVALSC
jgi:hypothetical protein